MHHGDGMGGQGVGEAPTSAPQAEKILGLKAVLLHFRVFFEWVCHAGQAQYMGK